MKAKDLDKKFESGEDLTDDLDFTKAQRVNIDFPVWIIEQLDKQENPKDGKIKNKDGVGPRQTPEY